VIVLAAVIPAAALLLLLAMDRLEARLLQPPSEPPQAELDHSTSAVTTHGTRHQQAGGEVLRIQMPVILARLSVEGRVHPEQKRRDERVRQT
jgi:hypothetical protein